MASEPSPSDEPFTLVADLPEQSPAAPADDEQDPADTRRFLRDDATPPLALQ